MPSSLLASGAVIEQASRGPVRRAPSAGLEHLQGPPSSVIRASAPSFLPVAELNVCLLQAIDQLCQFHSFPTHLHPMYAGNSALREQEGACFSHQTPA